jgi:hypothetical protein
MCMLVPFIFPTIFLYLFPTIYVYNSIKWIMNPFWLFFACLPCNRHFKEFEYCQYIPTVLNCDPRFDGRRSCILKMWNVRKWYIECERLSTDVHWSTGVSSFRDLLNGTTARVVVWIIAMVTLLGNTLVVTSRWLSTKESRILDVFVKNLAGT